MDERKILNYYTNPKLPGSFSGVSGFIKNNPLLKYNRNVKKTLYSIPEYTLHKPIRYTFQRNKTLVPGPNHQWQIDLVDMNKFAGSNSNYKYIFTCIDVFDKYAWAEPLISKTPENCKKVFENIIKNGRKPNYIYSDSGNEFKGVFKTYLNEQDIQIILASTKNKAAVVERFNRTLKERLFRYFEYNKKNKINNLHKNRYLDVLEDLISSYNNTYHRSIKMSPKQVNKNNQDIVFYNLYGFNKHDGDDRIIDIKFKKGTYVRILKDKTIFEKGYTSKWSDNIYIIDKIILSVPPVYELKEIKKNNEIKQVVGQYYAEELQKVYLPFDTYEILDESNEQIMVQKLNTDNAKEQIVAKTDFIANRLRSKK
jgi:hypothetical protein